MFTREIVKEISTDSTEDKLVVVYLPLSYQIGGYTLYINTDPRYRPLIFRSKMPCKWHSHRTLGWQGACSWIE